MEREAALRRRAILAELRGLGPVLPGSIVLRSTRCQSAGCHCRAEPPVLHGPYATWMRQEGGRQVTRTLSPEEAERMRPLLAADRRMKELVHELEQLTVREFADQPRTKVPALGSSRRKAGT